MFREKIVREGKYLSCALLTHSVRTLYMYMCRWNRISWQRQQEGRQLSGRQERRMPGACPWQLLLRPRSHSSISFFHSSTYLSCLCYLHVSCRVRANRRRRRKMSFIFFFFCFDLAVLFRLKQLTRFIFWVSLEKFELNLSGGKMFVILFLFLSLSLPLIKWLKMKSRLMHGAVQLVKPSGQHRQQRR